MLCFLARPNIAELSIACTESERPFFCYKAYFRHGQSPPLALQRQGKIKAFALDRHLA